MTEVKKHFEHPFQKNWSLLLETSVLDISKLLWTHNFDGLITEFGVKSFLWTDQVRTQLGKTQKKRTTVLVSYVRLEMWNFVHFFFKGTIFSQKLRERLSKTRTQGRWVCERDYQKFRKEMSLRRRWWLLEITKFAKILKVMKFCSKSLCFVQMCVLSDGNKKYGGTALCNLSLPISKKSDFDSSRLKWN